MNRQWTADQAGYQKYITVLAALNQQILLAVLLTYSATLVDPMLAYANVTPLQLLHHLTTTYGWLDQRELRANEKRLNNEWSPNTPIEDLWLHVCKIRHISEYGKNPIMEETAIAAVIEVLETSEVF